VRLEIKRRCLRLSDLHAATSDDSATLGKDQLTEDLAAAPHDQRWMVGISIGFKKTLLQKSLEESLGTEAAEVGLVGVERTFR